MICGRPNIARNERGAAAIEFALLAPVLFLIIIGVLQLGILFFANAGLKSAVGEAARFATLYPRPADGQITDVFNDRRFGLDTAHLATPTVTHGTADGRDYIDIRVSYNVPIDFLFFQTPPVTLVENRRVFIHPSS